MIDAIIAEQAPMRERAQRYLDDPTLVRNIVADGCDKARELAEETMRDVREVDGTELRLNMALELVHSQSQPLAKVRGEPLHELPHDLYIPPDALEVFLDAFEGPLDLLLYLIRKAEHQRARHPDGGPHRAVPRLRRDDAPQAPRARRRVPADGGGADRDQVAPAAAAPPAADDGEIDPRAELVRRLLEYEQMKAAAQKLDRLPLRDRDFLTVEVWIEQALGERLPDVRPQDLEDAWRSLLARARLSRHHLVTREQLSVREHMTGSCGCSPAGRSASSASCSTRSAASRCSLSISSPCSSWRGKG